MVAKTDESMTFEWKSNEDCTDLTCELSKGFRLMTWEIDSGRFFWSADSPKSEIAIDCGTKKSLLEAMRAAQTAYMEHVKTEAK